MKDWHIIGIASILSVLGTMLKDVATGHSTLDLLLGLFWKTQGQADFPFFYWFIFPAAGLLIGHYLIHCKDKHAVYRKVMPGTLVLGLLIEGFATLFNIGMASQFTEYFYLTLIDAVAVIIFSLFWFGFNDWWHTRFDSIRIKTLQRFSMNITSIYVVSWLLIGVLQVVRAVTWKSTQIGFWSATALALMVLILSDLMSRGYHTWQLKRRAE